MMPQTTAKMNLTLHQRTQLAHLKNLIDRERETKAEENNLTLLNKTTKTNNNTNRNVVNKTDVTISKCAMPNQKEQIEQIKNRIEQYVAATEHGEKSASLIEYNEEEFDDEKSKKDTVERIHDVLRLHSLKEALDGGYVLSNYDQYVDIHKENEEKERQKLARARNTIKDHLESMGIESRRRKTNKPQQPSSSRKGSTTTTICLDSTSVPSTSTTSNKVVVKRRKRKSAPQSVTTKNIRDSVSSV